MTELGAQVGVFISWLRALGFLLLPVLVIGGLALIVHSGTLDALLTASVFVLLLWVAGVSMVVARSRLRSGR